MDFKLKNKRVLVLGASSGLGFAIAKAFADEGAKVALCSRIEEKIQKASEKIKGSIPLVCDMNVMGECAKLVACVVQKWDGIDIVVTNSGGPPLGDFMNLKRKDWEKGFEGTFLSAQETIASALPHMQKQKWGRVILSTTAFAKEPIPALTISSSIRAALLILMRTLSHQLADSGITVNSILPSYIKTEAMQKWPITEEELIQGIPANRLGKPEEVGALAAFLGSEQAAFITGQAIACDGGLLRGL